MFVLLIVASVSITAQTRYADEVFTDDQIKVTTDVRYAANASVEAIIFTPPPEVGDWFKQELLVDIYEPDPAVDDVTNRPPVVFIHASNGTPRYILTCYGDKQDWNSTTFARALARRGYVVMVPNYRKGFNFLAPTTSAFYGSIADSQIRMGQDMKALMRWNRKSVAEDGNPYGIDAEKQILWGNSHGAGTNAIFAGYHHREEEFLTAAYTVLDTTIGMTPVNVYDQSLFGDVDGLTVAVNATGDTTNYVNSPGYSSLAAMVVAGRPVQPDTFAIEAIDAIPTIMYTARTDWANGLNGSAPLNMPGTEEFITNVYFHPTLHRKVNRLGLNDVWKGVEFKNPVANERVKINDVDAEPLEGFVWVESPNPANYWPWFWEDLDACKAITDAIGTTDFVETPQLTVDSTPETATTAINKIVEYVGPLACVALNLGCADDVTSTEELIESVALNIYPNPSYGNFELGAEDMMRKIEVFDIRGSLIANYNNINTTTYRISLNVPTGQYIAKVHFDEGVTTRKISVID